MICYNICYFGDAIIIVYVIEKPYVALVFIKFLIKRTKNITKKLKPIHFIAYGNYKKPKHKRRISK